MEQCEFKSVLEPIVGHTNKAFRVRKNVVILQEKQWLLEMIKRLIISDYLIALELNSFFSSSFLYSFLRVEQNSAHVTFYGPSLHCSSLLHLAFAIDFSIGEQSSSQENSGNRSFVDDVEFAIRAVEEPFRYYNL